jgi:UDP:flavonoid glycosyltransferase YjiC (YdhE family)
VKVVLLALGSHGDVQPMVALGKALKGMGVPVMVVALRNFAPLVEAAGLSFMPINRTLDESGPEAEAAARKMAGGGRSYGRAVNAWLADIAPQVTAAEMAAVEPGDVVIAGVLSIDDAVALQEARGCLAVHMLTAPVIPTASGPSTVFAIRPQGTSVLNRWAGRASLAAGTPMLTTTGRHLRDQLHLPRTSALGFLQMLQTVPTLLTTSPLVTPPADDWPANICQTGIWFDDCPTWDPPADLTEFLAAGDPPVFIGFGSMPSADPSADALLMMQSARRAGRRAVIRPSNGWSGSEDSPEDVYLLRDAPYRWLFPQMAAVIHHGGAGTTAEALLAGVPNAVVAFGVDQPYHGRRIHDLGAGPAPITRSQLNAHRLTKLITTLTRPAQAAKWLAGAAEARSQLLQERGLSVAVERLSMLMTNGDPLARSASTTD